MLSVARLASLLLVLAGAVAAGGCSQVQLVHQTNEHNQALEWSGNQIILLNAVRASKGYPYYFTVLGDMDGKDAMTGGAEIGPTSAISAFTNTLFGTLAQTATPPTAITTAHQYIPYRGKGNVAVNNGFSQFKVANANTDEFALSLTQPLNVNQVSIFVNSDWPTEHLAMMILRRIGLAEDDLHALQENYETRCRKPRDQEARLCELIQEAIDRCNLPPPDLVTEHIGTGVRTGKVYVFHNDPEDSCRFARFQAFVRAIVLAVPTMTPYEAPSANAPAKGGGGKAGASKSSSPRAGGAGDKVGGESDKAGTGGSQSPVINVTVNASDKAGDTKKAEPRPHLRVEIKRRTGRVDVVYLPTEGARAGAAAGTYFLLRSPGDMIDYLGRLIRVQLKSDPGIKPHVLVDYRHLVPFFKIERGLQIGRTAVSVRHEGEHYSVPPTGYDAEERHMTMQSLMLINQLLSMKVKRDNLRNSSSIFLVQ